MNGSVLIGILILGGLSVGWVLHNRSVRRVMPVLRRLAAEKNGTVQSPSRFLMPKLLFSYAGTAVEVSSASTGTAGKSTRYTYVLFREVDWKGFDFRILPRSVQTMTDEWVGLTKPMLTAPGNLDKRLTIVTNEDRLMEAVLSDRIQGDLLLWAGQKTENRISDIRNYDDKLIYAVTGTLESYQDYRLLLDTACRFYDAVTNQMKAG